MFERHGITTSEADEALNDPERVAIEPDYASKSGQSVRVIGYSHTCERVLTVILINHEGRTYGASGWVSNTKDQSIYHRKGGDDEQAF